MKDPRNCGDLIGLRFVIWARCSTTEQADTSIDDQLAALFSFGNEAGMTHVGNYVLEGVSGLSNRIHETVEQIIKRRRERGDVDVILVYDLSRLTRGGALDGAKLEYDLRAAGIRLISVMDDIPEGEFADVFKTFKHYASNAQSKAIAMAATRGGMTSIMAGRSSYGRKPPYGVDRLVSGPDGPRFVLHNLADGRQLKLEIGTRRVLTQFESNPERGGQRHYLKQSDETISFVPGDPTQIRTVNRIYRLFYIEGIGHKGIAHRLNDEGVPSPGGGEWFANTVKGIVRNPAYTGRGLANRVTIARHYQRSTAGPKPTPIRPEEMTRTKKPPQRKRPAEDWYWTEEAGLKDYFDEDLRELAVAGQDAQLEREAQRLKGPAVQRDKHSATSPFILRGRLFSVQGGHPMTGRTFKRPNRNLPPARYYAVTRGRCAPSSRTKILTRHIPAGPLDALVVTLLARQVAAMPGLKEVIRKMVTAQLDGAREADARLGELETELKNIAFRMGVVIRNAPLLGEAMAAEQLAELFHARHRVEAEVATLNRGRSMKPEEVDTVLDRIVANLQGAVDELPKVGKVLLDKLIELLLDRIEVDLETRHATISFSLPSWVLDEPQRCCLGQWPASKPSPEAAQPRLPLLTWRAYCLGDRYVAVVTAVGAGGGDSTMAA